MMNHSAKKIFSLACWISLSLSNTVLAADDYMSQLNSEAGLINSQDKDAAKTTDADGNVKSTRLPGLARNGYLPENMKQPKFENILKERYLGSYTFYAKLPEGSKREAYNEYLRTGHIEPTRQKIMARFLNR